MPPTLFHPANTAPLDFAEDDLSHIAEPLDTALAVAHADPETPSVSVRFQEPSYVHVRRKR
jgi:hypothetical protein